jgi:hypothetical protein
MLDKTKQMIRLGAAAKRAVREWLKKEWVKAWKKKKTSCPTKCLIQARRGCGTRRDCKKKQPPQSSYSCAQGV